VTDPESRSPVEERIPLRSHDEERLILGPYDRHARVVREVHRVTLVSREGVLKLLGEASAVRTVREKIEAILRRARGGDEPDEAAVIRAFSANAADAAAEKGPRGFSDVRPRTPGQGHYIEAIRTHAVTIAIGPAGTGKTFLAVAMAVEALRRGEFRRLVLARPAVEAGEKLGYLPGDLQAKVNPYLRPLYDALNDLLDPAAARRYVENDVIEICPLAYMRGRTLNSSFIILDEAQNTTPKQMQMFLTRMGESGKIVVTGDVTQVDLPDHAMSGLIDARRRLERISGVAIVELDRSDIVRHPLVSRIVEAYENGNP
jgi:phosphate starvation-inducible protein PhoH and related proteins